MSDAKKPPADSPAQPGGPSGQQPAAEADKRSGRVGYDERGNAVWEWQLETGVYSRDVNTQKLKKLELGDLSIAETAQHQKPPGIDEAARRMAGGGFNPYDNSPAPARSANPYDTARARNEQRSAPTPDAPPATGSKPRTPAELKKLEEWMKMKKRLENKKDD